MCQYIRKKSQWIFQLKPWFDREEEKIIAQEVYTVEVQLKKKDELFPRFHFLALVMKQHEISFLGPHNTYLYATDSAAAAAGSAAFTKLELFSRSVGATRGFFRATSSQLSIGYSDMPLLQSQIPVSDSLAAAAAYLAIKQMSVMAVFECDSCSAVKKRERGEGERETERKNRLKFQEAAAARSTCAAPMLYSQLPGV